MVYLGADHRGFKHKEKLKAFLDEQGYQVTDIGTNSEKSVDYPVIAQKVAKKVSEDPNNRGILLCGSGVGVCIAANKFKGIRAGSAWTEEVARSARADDNVNVLCLAADDITVDDTKQIARAFLNTSFRGEDRYKRRIAQIEEIEKGN
ncbi:MAG: hypothetical protein A2751_04070 [Candidatus Doudnabacteria bacterium RIFCSPHIGHO2_01_FULL_46_14]|uniref:Ribose 5-phosphate isomerase B n=1 Tax=Candidatus Doudnabacteria bacterium RIFCSPHIGHO2_01_FULL_46_14 TaxID=1817824 RepID=A0A1F5NKU4_9BACT|nr:MAG: hypothetical protein A2751_04070 [Candidatus Doudnabacteria bacterium RIFCSPHIGHO2_01_FULL_46_14]